MLLLPAMVSSPAGDEGLPRVVDDVTAEIRSRIADGRYPPGYRLVEPDLVQEFGAGRNSLREALNRLGGEGLVLVKPYRGAVVRRLSRGEVIEICQVRSALEGLAARLAAEQIGAGSNRQAFEQVWQRSEAAWKEGDLRRLVDAGRELHHTVAQIAGNESVRRLLQQLQLQSFRAQFNVPTDITYHRRMHELHGRLARAIMAGHGAQAERTMRADLARTEAQLRSLSESEFEQPSGSPALDA